MPKNKIQHVVLFYTQNRLTKEMMNHIHFFFNSIHPSPLSCLARGTKNIPWCVVLITFFIHTMKKRLFLLENYLFIFRVKKKPALLLKIK